MIRIGDFVTARNSGYWQLNLFTYPWDMDKNANLIYSGWDLIKS